MARRIRTAKAARKIRRGIKKVGRHIKNTARAAGVSEAKIRRVGQYVHAKARRAIKKGVKQYGGKALNKALAA